MSSEWYRIEIVGERGCCGGTGDMMAVVVYFIQTILWWQIIFLNVMYIRKGAARARI